MPENNINLVKKWHDNLNSGNHDQLIPLVTSNVKIGGPRGTGEGISLFLDWIERANIRLEALRFFEKDDKIIVEEAAKWLSKEDDNIIGESLVYSVFTFENNQISSIIRYDDKTEVTQKFDLEI
jgi:hypothetical protein